MVAMSIGTLIWIACRPLIRLVLTAAAGFAFTRAGLFPPVAARSGGQIVLNISFPCLLFSKIVTAFTPQHLSALGPLVLVASIYEILGIFIAWVVGLFFWVPHRFRYGILVAGGWSNWGDLPTAFIMSIMGAAPFNPSTDPTIAVAYISAFLLVFMISLFPMGGINLIIKDFVGPDVELEEVKETHRRKRREMIMKIPRLLGSLVHSQRDKPSVDEELGGSTKSLDLKTDIKPDDIQVTVDQSPVQSLHHRHRHDDSITLAPTVVEDIPSTSPQPLLAPRSRIRRSLRFVWTLFMSMMNAPSLSIFISFPIALLPPLKFLFVPPSTPSDAVWMGKTINIPNAPDGQPPLAFVMDTATFIGNASVPLGLICLGSALSRMTFPRSAENVVVEGVDGEEKPSDGTPPISKRRKGKSNNWTEQMPIGAIMGLAIGKMVLMPVLGVLIVEGLVRVGVIPESDKVLRFVCIFFSCLPTATTQVFITQVYSGTGDAEFLSQFLIPQYFLMIFSMTMLTAYSLNILFP